jgi:hypothetical protein
MGTVGTPQTEHDQVSSTTAAPWTATAGPWRSEMDAYGYPVTRVTPSGGWGRGLTKRSDGGRTKGQSKQFRQGSPAMPVGIGQWAVGSGRTSTGASVC